jgi:hypothetical protein
VASASFRPINNHYSKQTGVAGPGTINVSFTGKKFNTGGKTGLGNTGVGFFARRVKALKK